jgi:hypothetical protein
MFTLYNAPQSTCSQRVRFVLNAKQLAFDEVKLDLLAGDQLKPDYLALNPNGVVPTLDHDGNIVIDSSVIIEYLDEVEPGIANFTPREPATRAAMRSLMRFIDEMPAAAVRVPTFNLAFLPRFAAMSEDEFVAFAESKPLRKEFMLAMGRKGFPQKDGSVRWVGPGGRNWLGEVSSRGFQLAAVTLPGLVPIQLHGPAGTLPVQTASEPSALAFSITCSATIRPSVSPA